MAGNEEGEGGQAVCETKQFSASGVKGIYGKSKAEASAYVQKAAERGLHIMIVHPSGLIGPGDYSGSYMTETIKAFLKGYLPCAVEGGHDFVDVRDVADGIIRCIDNGKSGETYILSDEYITVRRMFDILGSVSGKRKVWGTIPLGVLRCASPLFEKVEKNGYADADHTVFRVYAWEQWHFQPRKSGEGAWVFGAPDGGDSG